jgi:ABC-type branched-subunit amino acid transport system permease subunit
MRGRLKRFSQARYLVIAVGLIFITIVLVILPRFITVPYFLHIIILTALYLVLSLSYDLTVGHVGALSLAHAAFFGIGAYTGALLVVNYSAPIGLAFFSGALLGCVLALFIGIPSFRVGGHAFAIVTLGFALTVELIARNWIGLTRGPMGIPGIPRPVLSVLGLFTWHITTLVDFYYLMMVIVFLSITLYTLITKSRVGRAFRAVREDEVLASANGIDPILYKMLAFTIGAGMAGAVGVFYSYWFGLVSPEILGLQVTVTLLIIIFIGGRASLRGIIVGAIVVTALPEFLRITTELRLILYGLILLMIIMRFPDGIEGLFRRIKQRV